MSTPSFPAPDTDRLAGLVFELASQLHVERAQRVALEAVLVKNGLIAADAKERMTDDVECHRRTVEALEESMSKLMRVLTERTDPRTPLRGGG
jgi:hypothetical protein